MICKTYHLQCHRRYLHRCKHKRSDQDKQHIAEHLFLMWMFVVLTSCQRGWPIHSQLKHTWADFRLERSNLAILQTSFKKQQWHLEHMFDSFSLQTETIPSSRDSHFPSSVRQISLLSTALTMTSSFSPALTGSSLALHFLQVSVGEMVTWYSTCISPSYWRRITSSKLWLQRHFTVSFFMWSCMASTSQSLS